jgi:hypothetical protein
MFGVAKSAWLIPTISMVVAVALSAAGVAEWRMTGVTESVGHICPSSGQCNVVGPAMFETHRLHPLRAELLSAASALFALVASGVGLLEWKLRTTGRPARV